MAKIDKSPKHGTTNETPDSESQADGTAASAPRGETQPGGKSDPRLRSETPENREGRLNPSAPTEGTEIDHAATKGAPLNDTFNEAGDPYGRGNLEIPDTVVQRKKDEAA